MINPRAFIAITAVSAVLLSCGGGHDAEQHELHDSLPAETRDTTPVTVNDTTKFKFDFTLANIPSPANSVRELENYNAPYDASILNDVSKASSYTTEYDRGMNLGIYNIDMAYAMVNDKGQDVLQYMKHILALSDALGLKGAVNMMVGKRAEANMHNRDSLFRILDEIFVKSDSYLRTNERVFTATTVFAGSWLESLYLTCKISEKVDDAALKARARRQLWEQRFHLGNLINLLNDYKDKKECAALLADLRPIHGEINAVKRHEDLDDAKFKSIASKIYALRSKVTR